MPDSHSVDAYSPKEIAGRVRDFCIVKAQLPLLSMAMLGMLAGAFIGLGALMFTLVASDAGLGFAATRLLGGLGLSLGLVLVTVAGAELFTGNNLLAMAWADGCVSTRQVLRNWLVVCAANFVGAAGLVIAGNLVGGSVLVALVYYVIYVRAQRMEQPGPASPDSSPGSRRALP